MQTALLVAERKISTSVVMVQVMHLTSFIQVTAILNNEGNRFLASGITRALSWEEVTEDSKAAKETAI